MKFQDYKYERMDVAAFKETCEQVVEKMQNAPTYEIFKEAFHTFDDLQAQLDTMRSLCEVRHTVNTEDAFYDQENDFWDENMPLMSEAINKVEKTIMASKYLEEFKKDVPEPYIKGIEFGLKAFDEKIIPDLQEENRLCSAYSKLIASAQIPFNGETYTLASLGVKMVDADRTIREKAFKAYWGWFEEHEDEIDTLYDKMVKVRDGIAKKLGFKDYVELGYLRMNRFDYNRDDVANYRRQVLEDVVPLANTLYDRQKKRLGYDTLTCFDEKFEFNTGNPAPKYKMDELVRRTAKMYRELSKETGEFFDYMVEHDLMDLEAKKGKAGGGYCTCITNYGSPFIFSNANGTSGDVETLTHEAGHAFQVYSSMKIRPVNCIWPTLESCEIHSMSMEFLTWPWMKNFFEEDVDKFYFLHLSDSIKFIPYGILVDHFQHVVYENPDMTPAQRKQAYRDLEKQYLPHKNYEDCPLLEKGTWWYRQSHIFTNPFYYVDYTLAQTCALQFWKRSFNKEEGTFADYLNICKIGGTKTFTNIVKAANLNNPFEDGCLKDVMKNAQEYLDKIDDTTL